MQVELNCPTLASLDFEARQLCDKAGVAFDPFKIGVTTDYGTRVVVYLIEREGDKDER